MISELRTFQTYEHPRFPGGFVTPEILLYTSVEVNLVQQHFYQTISGSTSMFILDM